MKNQLKITFGIALISLFSIGCKKDSTQPRIGQKTGPAKFTVSSNTFKGGVVDHDLLKKNKINGPHVAWENAPAGAKGYWIIMDDDKKHVYWYSGGALANFSSLREAILGPFSYPIFRFPDKNGTTAAIEIFALNCTPVEFSNIVEKEMSGERITEASRATLRKILEKGGLFNIILGSAVVKYKINP